MAANSLQAWVLHQRPAGDTSARVTFFTREAGVMHSLCKGGRTLKKQAILQPFTLLWLAVDKRYGYDYVRGLEPTATIISLQGQTLFAGLYLNELIYYALAPMDAHPELFDSYLQTLQGLAIATDRLMIEALLRRFEWALLSACGQALSFASVVAESYYDYEVGANFVVSEQGSLSGHDILAFAKGQWADVQVLKTAKIIMRQAINHLLGGRILKSRSLYLR